MVKVSSALSNAKNWVSENRRTIAKTVAATAAAVAFVALAVKFGQGFYTGYTPADGSFADKFSNGGAAGFNTAGEAVKNAYTATVDTVVGLASSAKSGVQYVGGALSDAASTVAAKVSGLFSFGNQTAGNSTTV